MKTFATCLLCLVLTLADTSVASAQYRSNYGCGQVRAVQVHHAPTYHAPALKAFAPYALPVAVTPDYYFSTSSYYRDSLLADAIVGRLLTQGQQLQQPGQPLQQPTTLPQRLPATQPQQMPPPQAAPQPQGVQLPAAQPFDPQLFGQIVQQSCINCHGASAKRGNFDISGWATMDAGTRWFVVNKVGTQKMPPPEDVAKGKAHPVNDLGFNQFLQWAEQAGSPLRPGK